MTADPLAGPFPFSLMLTDYSDMPGYAILPVHDSDNTEGNDR
jgi:hypothetical protein